MPKKKAKDMVGAKDKRGLNLVRPVPSTNRPARLGFGWCSGTNLGENRQCVTGAPGHNLEGRTFCRPAQVCLTASDMMMQVSQLALHDMVSAKDKRGLNLVRPVPSTNRPARLGFGWCSGTNLGENRQCVTGAPGHNLEGRTFCRPAQVCLTASDMMMQVSQLALHECYANKGAQVCLTESDMMMQVSQRAPHVIFGSLPLNVICFTGNDLIGRINGTLR
ncbi:hypothetical protein Bbelb_279120 [Branchiostoma belcheri]|nr:hypothetical protein Bbelb_279120 [Branchiostoma belcheri]